MEYVAVSVFDKKETWKSAREKITIT